MFYNIFPHIFKQKFINDYETISNPNRLFCLRNLFYEKYTRFI